MIKNLVINGCSFTADQNNTWASVLKNYFLDIEYYNIACEAAGNDYICNSTINYLEQLQLDPSNTLVLIMWSGTGRKDLNIAGEWWYHLHDNYTYGSRHGEQYYLFSGGLTNSWTTNKTTKKIFEWLYKLSDPTTLCQNSMMNFLNLENYLKANGYQYRFTSYVNYWDPVTQSNFNAGDYSIGYFCKDYALYQKYNFANWFFVNDRKDCLAEFALQLNELDDTGHPTLAGHTMFAKQIVIPLLTAIFTN